MVKSRTRILLVEDGNGSTGRSAVERRFQENGLPYELVVARSADEGISRLRDGSLDLALLDSSIPNGFVLKVKQAAGDLACIFLTPAGDSSAVAEAMRQGAEDYLIKDEHGEYLDILPTVVSNALERTHIRAENRNYRDCLEHMVRQRVEEMKQFLLEKQAANQQQSIETLIHHHRLESMGKLTAGLAHEINNPLNGIINYGDLILMDIDCNSPAFRWASGVVEESLKIAAIVRNLLSYTSVGEETSGQFAINDIIEGTLSLVRHGFSKHQIAISTKLHEDLPLVRCRRQSIQQVLLSLLDNAKDALNDRFSGWDEKKRILIRGRRIERDGRPWARVTVEDSGSGLRDATTSQAFEPFYTTKAAQHAAGLGLPISLHIINSHGGDLALDSDPDRGTRVHIDLPGILG